MLDKVVFTHISAERVIIVTPARDGGHRARLLMFVVSAYLLLHGIDPSPLYWYHPGASKRVGRPKEPRCVVECPCRVKPDRAKKNERPGDQDMGPPAKGPGLWWARAFPAPIHRVRGWSGRRNVRRRICWVRRRWK